MKKIKKWLFDRNRDVVDYNKRVKFLSDGKVKTKGAFRKVKTPDPNAYDKGVERTWKNFLGF